MTTPKIHREFKPYLIAHAISLLLAVGIFLWYNTAWYYPLGWCAIQIPTFLFTAYFFRYRDPSLPESPIDNALVSPADGHIVALEPSLENPDTHLRLSIYLHGTDTHLIRIPCTAKVEEVTYHPGKHLVAFNPKSSTLNERLSITLRNGLGEVITMTLVAGLLARRIRPYITQGQDVKVGEELGYILLGSRVDMEIPNSFLPKVGMKQKVLSSETILGYWA